MKAKNKIKTLTVSLAVTTLLAGVFVEKVFAHPHVPSSSRSSGGSGLFPATRHTPPHVLPSPVPPFPYKWRFKDVISSLNKNGIQTQEIEPVTQNNEHLPAKAKEGTKFSIPSSNGEVAGCILCFDDKKSLEKVTTHYRTKNEKGELYNWSFVKDNVLLILPGSMPEETARQYEKALYEMKEAK